MKEEVFKAREAIIGGQTLLYPTDTVWGIGCDATNDDAVDKVYEVKERPKDKAFIILVHEINLIQKYVKQVPDIAWDLVDYAEDPLTVIYPEGRNVSPKLMNEDGSIAIRLVKKNDFLLSLLEGINRPLVSTSANLSGMPGARVFGEIEETILNRVDYIVNWQQQEKNPQKPSKIVKIGLGGEIKFLRK